MDSWKPLYPFASHFFTTKDGHKLHYIDENQSSRKCMLMLHGNPTWSFMYRELIKRASAEGYRAVAIDNIGCGLSDKPQDWPYHLENHIQNVIQLVEELHLDHITLVNHDWGGAIGMGFATRFPEKISRLVLMNTAAFLSTDCPKRIFLCRCPLLGAVMVRGFNAFVEAAIRMAPAHKLPEDVQAGYRAPYGNWHDRIATQRFVQDIPLSPEHPTYSILSTIESQLPLLADKPISLIWGEKDFCFHTGFLKIWQQKYPKAKTFALPNASHYLLEDAPDEVISHILENA